MTIKQVLDKLDDDLYVEQYGYVITNTMLVSDKQLTAVRSDLQQSYVIFDADCDTEGTINLLLHSESILWRDLRMLYYDAFASDRWEVGTEDQMLQLVKRCKEMLNDNTRGV